MSEFNIDDLDEVIASADSSLVQMLALQLKKQIGISKASDQQLAAVVAENAVLKSKAAELVHEASEVYSAYNATITEPDGDFMDMQTLQEMQCVETPATDSYLAEVRASEAKHVYDSILDNPAVTDMGSLVDWLEQDAKDSASFAAQLRQGAAL